MIDPVFQKRYESMVKATDDRNLIDAMFDVVQYLSVTVDGLRARVLGLEEELHPKNTQSAYDLSKRPKIRRPK